VSPIGDTSLAKPEREGTRFASESGSSGSIVTPPCLTMPGDITNCVFQLVPLRIDPRQVNVNLTQPPSDLPMCAGTPIPGCPVKVEVDYNFNLIFPLNF
jgi:hypothetical protein